MSAEDVSGQGGPARPTECLHRHLEHGWVEHGHGVSQNGAITQPTSDFVFIYDFRITCRNSKNKYVKIALSFSKVVLSYN